MFPLEITKHFVAAHVEISEEQGFCANTFFAIIESERKQFSDLTKLFLNHPLTNLDRNLFEDHKIDNVANPTLVKGKWKKCEKQIEEKHVPNIMDSSDFENASGKNSFWVFSISYSGSDKFLFA